jgi:uncharacterized Ntn-hydrolase superfamily protein
MKKTLIVLVMLISPAIASAIRPVSTFSIVACDTATGELGVAVASKYFAVGAIVPWAKSGVGAIATQSYVNPDYGIIGLELLQRGLSPQEVIDSLTRADSMFARRQVGIVDAQGNSATFTGRDCLMWAGGMRRHGCAAQGNILVRPSVVASMIHTFENTSGELADKLLSALLAGDSAGGDSRGRQSAALYVVAPGQWNRYDTKIDIRVDDHRDPFGELTRLYKLAKALSRLDLAYRLRMQGDLAGAVEAAHDAVELNPDIPETHYDYACYLSLNGEHDMAMAALTRSIRMAPKFKSMAVGDQDLEALRVRDDFKRLIGQK